MTQDFTEIEHGNHVMDTDLIPATVRAELAAARAAVAANYDAAKHGDIETWLRGIADANDQLAAALGSLAGALAIHDVELFLAVMDGSRYRRVEARSLRDIAGTTVSTVLARLAEQSAGRLDTDP